MKKAFLVGINKYNGSPLNGCVNDCLLMYKGLTERFGFENNNVNIITDGECTKKNIVCGLEQLVLDVKPGDTILFHYSGHGSQVVSNNWTNTKEADGRDEILCPFDLDWNDPLTDNDLNKIFKKVPAGVTTIIVLDCCHSGTGLRNFFHNKSKHLVVKDVLNRYLAPPISNLLSNPKISLDNNLQFVFPKFNKKDLQTKLSKFIVQTSEQGEAILISGCGENQTSADAYIGDRYHGALTFTLFQILAANNYVISYRKLIKEVNKVLKEAGFEQVPQLECKKEYMDRNFLA
jgi:hypothetical protein